MAGRGGQALELPVAVPCVEFVGEGKAERGWIPPCRRITDHAGAPRGVSASEGGFLVLGFGVPAGKHFGVRHKPEGQSVAAFNDGEARAQVGRSWRSKAERPHRIAPDVREVTTCR